MSVEIWQPVKDFEGLYEVSNLGKVKSIERNGTKGGVLKQHIDRYGYLKVVLHKKNKPHYFTVHRLVATAFVENPENKPAVDHIDCDRKNNKASNLRWCSVKENVYFSHKLGHQKWNAKAIIATSPTGETIKCSSQHDAAINTGVSQTNVGKCANGKTDKVKGWAFRYG